MFYVYSLPGCKWCEKAKKFLDEKGEAYYEVSDRETVVDVVKKYGQKTVPQVFYYKGPDEKLPGHIGGYEDLVRWYSDQIMDGPIFPKKDS